MFALLQVLHNKQDQKLLPKAKRQFKAGSLSNSNMTHLLPAIKVQAAQAQKRKLRKNDQIIKDIWTSNKARYLQKLILLTTEQVVITNQKHRSQNRLIHRLFGDG